MFKNKFFLSPRFFETNREEINSENKIQMNILGRIGAVIAAIVFVTSFFLEALTPNSRAYLFLSLMSLFSAVISGKLPDKSKLVLPLFYFYYFCCFAFAIFVAIAEGDSYSMVPFCAFLVILPNFMIDKQWRVFSFLGFVVLSYFLCGYFFAPDRFDSVYVMDCLAFALIAMGLHSYNMRLLIKHMESRLVLARRVETDSLTQLYNRSALEKHILAYIASSEENAAFILLDVDNFKSINDSFGHSIGDEILCQTAAILKEQFRRSDYVGRLGGDEFVIFLPRVTDIAWLKDRIQCIVDDMDRTFIGDAAVCNVSSSIGVALYPEHGITFEDLYKNADTAMYESKNKGKNRYTIYDESMSTKVQD